MRPHPLFVTTGTAVYGHQPALLHIKLFRLIHYPFVMPVAAQGFALVLFLQGGLAKRNDLAHNGLNQHYSRVRRSAAFHDARRLRRAVAFICTANSRSTCQIFFTSEGFGHRPTPRPAR